MTLHKLCEINSEFSSVYLLRIAADAILKQRSERAWCAKKEEPRIVEGGAIMDLGICVGVLLLRSRLYNYAGVPLSPLNIDGEIESQRVSHCRCIFKEHLAVDHSTEWKVAIERKSNLS